MLKYEHLLGRPFKYGTQDCYSLIRDFYRDNFSIQLRNYARPDEFWDKGMNLYLENFLREGFQPLDILPMYWRPGDAILMAIRSSVANHAAVFVDRGFILHHLIDNSSRLDRYRGLFRNTTVAVLRHRDVHYEEPETKLDLMETLPDVVRQKLTSVLPGGNEGTGGGRSEEPQPG